MLEGYLNVNGIDVPRTLLGTSPFIGAPHFGHRSRLYLLDLYRKPEAMAHIIIKSYQLGVRGIQLQPYPPVVEALEMARDQGYPMDIVGTIRPDPEDDADDLELLTQLGAKAILLNASLTDLCNWDLLGEKLNEINDKGVISGLITQMPFKTTSKLLSSPILDDFQIYMVPVNRLGYLMDCDTHGPEDRARFRELIQNMGKTILVNKVLAAGIMTPDDAFDYIKTLDFVDMVAVGIASEAEAEETFNKLAEH